MYVKEREKLLTKMLKKKRSDYNLGHILSGQQKSSIKKNTVSVAFEIDLFELLPIRGHIIKRSSSIDKVKLIPKKREVYYSN